MADSLFIADPRARIFLGSFAMLVFGLLCIGWILAYVRFLSYFNTFLLLVSFLGMNLGSLSGRHERFWAPFPADVLLLVVVTVKCFDLQISSTDVLYYRVSEVL